MKKICPRCSANFTCREDRKDLCRCSRVYLSSEVKYFIKESYESCLCPECLKETNTSFYSFGVNPQYMVKKDH